MGSKFHTRNITCIVFPVITVSNKIIKISEYGKVIILTLFYFKVQSFIL